MLETIITGLLRLERRHKRIVQLATDAALMSLSFAAAMVLRFESLAPLARPEAWLAIALAILPSLLIFTKLGFYRAVIRFITIRAIQIVFVGIFASALILLLVSQLLGLPVPRSVPVIYGLLAICLLGGVRMAMRRLFGRRARRGRTKVLIYGAGASGRQLLSSLQQGEEYDPVAFIDDAGELQGTVINGMPVHAPDKIESLVALRGVELVLLALPSVSRPRRKEIIDRLEAVPVRFQTIPGMADLVSGRAQVSELRDVSVEDLLGRDPVPARAELMASNISGKVVMVTGAGGSIGSELCRQILGQGPATLVLWEMSEFALYSIELELRERIQREGLAVRLVPLIGSVQNPGRVRSALRRFGVQTIYHAAAYKHVPLVEHNVVEGLRNNVFGTRILVDEAMDAGVEAFILISTDKAVRPTNIMGASKRLAELVCQAAAARGTRTVFSMVRFGNVLGSSGSVIPRFRAQVEAGGPVTVTAPDITRYFMTISEAAQLVIQAGAMAQGGDVFVLDMGEPIRIVDLAERIIRLSGFVPYREDAPRGEDGQPPGDIEIRFTGLRPGEKRFEELLIGRAARPTLHPRIMTATEEKLTPSELDALLDRLLEACLRQDVARLRSLISAAPTGYKPDRKIADLLWGQDAVSEPRRRVAN
ncbi:polysaccharide biosynthesis protein [Roseovarius sp. SCSIO 43702]|uniref:polysaccharide biosynthesis protein n=1 Tax=Roseovarius sp. SCSIO 43702 TaxID=2823043 RepID=UPI001C732E55|nr:nucleoside-diphosphate sugar epimerase/dehydratase [Roseovarius sp. SCSIO 43702]QYX56764.1 polysaccharide biosynthesis protein [Roseovarius sp. SCSIO 43702]